MINPALLSLAIHLALVPLVASHGWIGSISIDEKRYEGNTLGSTSVPSPIMSFESNGPTPLDSPKSACGPTVGSASLTADASPGSTLSVQWRSDGEQPWQHLVGPLMTYMASCGSTSCETFDSADAKWFKIAQFSYINNATNTWWQSIVHDKKPIDIKLPENITPGGYLVRHEIIGMHVYPPEYYPGCIQINMGGNGNGTPDLTVSFPGAYSPTDIKADAFNTKPESFTFPGGPLSNLASLNQNPGGSAGVSGDPGSGSGSGAQTSSPEATPTSTITDGDAPAAIPSASSSQVEATTVSTPVASPAMSSSLPPASTGQCRRMRRRASGKSRRSRSPY